jgi:DNA-binding SARP family transcriptional activator
MVAEVIAGDLSAYTRDTLALVEQVAVRWPGRWRPVLRTIVSAGPPESQIRAGRVLEKIGEQRDVALLRRIAKGLAGQQRQTSGDLGRGLARRLAARVVVEDFGHVVVRIGDRMVTSAEMRPKALAMLCFLAAQRDLGATRDQVLEALWPEFDPGAGVNSLHQTVYFLRRTLEDPYDQDTSAGYIQQDGDVLRLDPELVDSWSHRFRKLTSPVVADPDVDTGEQLVHLYVAPFATDFMYDDWALRIRDGFHARYVDLVERAVRRDMDSGHYDRALSVARRALEVDPDLDEVERLMVRVFRMSGSHAAAAEQYAHYSASMADLGVEVPLLENL